MESFRFSSELQSSLRKFSYGVSNVPNYGDIRHQIEPSSQLEISSKENSISNLAGSFEGAVVFESIITIMQRSAAETTEMIPDSNELHIPFVKTLSLYDQLARDFKFLNPNSNCPTLSYFYHVWNENCFQMKVTKNNRLSKCGTWDRIRSALLHSVTRGISTKGILEEQRAHIELIGVERKEYKRKNELDMINHHEYLSILVDGADK